MIRRMMLQMRDSLGQSESTVTRAKLVRFAGSAIVGLFMTGLRLLGMQEGVGFSFAAALPLPFTISGAIGCLFGELHRGLDGKTLFPLIILLFSIAVRVLVRRSLLSKHCIGLFWQTLALGSLLLGRAVVTYIIADLSLMDLIRSLLQGVVQTVVFIVSSVAVAALLSEKAFIEYRSAETAAIVVLAVLLLTALDGYSFGGVGLADILAVMIVTIFAYRYGWIGGGISGILCGIGVLLSDTDKMEFAAILTLGAFLAGFTAQRSKLFAAASMLIVHFVLVLLYGKPLQMLPVSLATLLGCIGFLAMPMRFLDGFVLPLTVFGHDPPQQKYYFGQLQEKLQIRMEFAAEVMEMLNESVEELAQALQCDVRPDPEQVYHAVEVKLCSRCKRRYRCYGEDYDQIRESFNGLGGQLRQKMILTPETFPDFMKENCVRTNDLIRVFTESYEQLRFASEQQRQTSRLREVVSEQYTATAQMLKSLGQVLRLIPDQEAEEAVNDLLGKEGYSAQRILCVRDDKERLFLELYYKGEIPPIGELTALLERCLTVKLEAAVIADGHNLTRISLYEPTTYGIQLGVTQRASDGKAVNGDTVTHFQDGKGNYYLLLSDGMGQGRHAAWDSRTVCTILSKLIVSGFDWQTAMRLLNTVLTVKSAEESLATVDIIRINLYDGETEFIKAGAASSYWLGEKSVTRIRSFTLPLGIISGIRFDSKKISAMPGDTLLLFSDGITNDENKVAKFLFSAKELPIHRLTERICEELADATGNRKDDRTVAAIRLIQYQTENKRE